MLENSVYLKSFKKLFTSFKKQNLLYSENNLRIDLKIIKSITIAKESYFLDIDSPVIVPMVAVGRLAECTQSITEAQMVRRRLACCRPMFSSLRYENSAVY